MSRIEALYPRFPIPLQHGLVSLQGLIFRMQRYPHSFERELSNAIKVAESSLEELESLQLQMLKEFVSHAVDNSLFYRERARAVGFLPDTISTLTDLRHLPILEKAELRQFTEEIASSKYRNDAAIRVHTSGTTGSSIHVGYTRADMRQRLVCLHRMLRRYDVSPLARSVRFSGRTLFPDAMRNGIFWRHNWPMNQLLMSSYDLHPDKMNIYIKKMEKFKPDLIDGYPSSIYVVARHINAHGQSGRIRPKVVMTTAETLEDYQREEISQAFGGCRVANQYASSEGAPFITEDEYGDLVVNSDSGVFEYVKPGTDEPAANGELAELVVTSFTTHAYPLIRYRIGDTVMLPAKPRLARSWNMPVVEKIMGRQEDILYTRHRGYVGSLNKVFANAPDSVVESQIVQISDNEVVLRIVLDGRKEFLESDLSGSIRELKDRLGDVSVSIEYHEKLPRGANGKLRAVVGMIAHEQPPKFSA